MDGRWSGPLPPRCVPMYFHSSCGMRERCPRCPSSTACAPSPAQTQQLYRLIGGYRVSQAISVVAKLGIADLLASGPQGSDELARATETNEPALYRVLRFLVGVGLFDEMAPRSRCDL